MGSSSVLSVGAVVVVSSVPFWSGSFLKVAEKHVFRSTLVLVNQSTVKKVTEMTKATYTGYSYQ